MQTMSSSSPPQSDDTIAPPNLALVQTDHHQDDPHYDDSLDSSSEMDPNDTSPHSRKRKRSETVSPRIIVTAESQRIEQQLMSNVSWPHRQSYELPSTSDFATCDTQHVSIPAMQLANLPAQFTTGLSSRERVHLDDTIQLAARTEECRSSWTSYLPLNLPLGSRSVFYLSEAFPRSFDHQKRSILLEIFRARAPYVPSRISLATELQQEMKRHVCSPSPPRERSSGLSLRGAKESTWPADLPLEIFDIIARHLPRRSIQNMRLVNHDFERKVSCSLFHTVVVPFRDQIYGLITQNDKDLYSAAVDIKGERKAFPSETEKAVHDGIKTFEAWGRHIKRFAMAFEVEESTLESPPFKVKYETHETCWGHYKWPHPHYNRFEFCEGLEKKADEFRCMSAALSKLTAVAELALSIDSGLGWLVGSDLSDRANMLREKPRIFGKKHLVLDPSPVAPQDISTAVRKRVNEFQSTPGLPLEHRFHQGTLGQQNNSDEDPRILALRDFVEYHDLQSSSTQPLMFGGVDIRQAQHSPINTDRCNKSRSSTSRSISLIPNSLSTPQQEWLLETEWAQRAFISSFCMALCDNSLAFRMVTTLNIARLSSNHLSSLRRTDIWLALQKLETLTINVSADWRHITKDAAGLMLESAVRPSATADQFFHLLQDYVTDLPNVKNLNIGYVGGGEHQCGIYGRNRHILPAPIADLSEISAAGLSLMVMGDAQGILELQHVEHLSFTNCWFTPHVMTNFCIRARSNKLKTLTLNSVSLTSHAQSDTMMNDMGTGFEMSFTPQGPPRYGDPSVANFFDLRSDNLGGPSPNGWISNPPRKGSWGQVIDSITPGANLKFVRYAYQYSEKFDFESFKNQSLGNLKSITFESCGYISLTKFQGLNFQGPVVATDSIYTPGLTHRASELRKVMMEIKDDKLLGQIVPRFPRKERDVLETGFPMRFGWIDEAEAAQCLEDGQLLGGSGRFSGKVQRLTFLDEK